MPTHRGTIYTTTTRKESQCLPLDMHPDFMSVTDLSYGSHVFHMSTQRGASISDDHYWCATTGNVLLHSKIQCNCVLDSMGLLITWWLNNIIAKYDITIASRRGLNIHVHCNSQFWPIWEISIAYVSIEAAIDPLKCGAWWLAWDTMVYVQPD